MQPIRFLLTPVPFRSALPLALLAVCALGACAARAPAAPPPPPKSEPRVVPPPPPPPPPPVGHEQVLITNVTNDKNSPYLGVLDREGLDAVIDQGLGRVLGRLKVSPVLQRGQFQGFRVTGVDVAWKAAGIAVDDVILRLNGQPIERPEQAQAAFESLRVASEISLDLLREGKPKKLRYRIESR
jgi:hypothetical protein